MISTTLRWQGLSFRQLLLAAFLLIAVLLSATSVQALLMLEQWATNSRSTARDAVRLTENVQILAERTVAMERSARQFMVLDDPSFRSRYEQAADQAREALDALVQDMPVLAEQAQAWQIEDQFALHVLQAPTLRRVAMESRMLESLGTLADINDHIAHESKLEVERRNGALQDALEKQRGLLALLTAGAILLSILLAFGFGWWLTRPMSAIERAIGRLGENRFDQAIDVDGPADLRRLGQQLDWLRQRLADLEDDKERFLRHISHELKTPLAALCEGVALLEDEVVGPLTDSQREVARILSQNTTALQTQIEDLLRFNAASFDAQRLVRVPVDVRGVIEKVVAEQTLQWQVKKMQIAIASDGAVPTVVAGDADKLSIVFGNLLSNAVRFSPEGGTVDFVLSSAHGKLLVDCKDEGPGVAEADVARVFEPFYQGQTQPPGARRGSGIGLSIVREYIEAHGGAVRLRNAGPGAHFQIELPHER